MADLVIGGNTHKGIIYLKVKKSDGTTATFIDFSQKDQHQIKATLVHTKGEAFDLSASVKLGKPTAYVKKENV